MIELTTAIPDVDVLLALEPEELAAKVILLLRSRGEGRFHDTALAQANAHAMVRRRAATAGIATRIGNHTFPATGITAYLKHGGTLENAGRDGQSRLDPHHPALRPTPRQRQPGRGRADPSVTKRRCPSVCGSRFDPAEPHYDTGLGEQRAARARRDAVRVLPALRRPRGLLQLDRRAEILRP